MNTERKTIQDGWLVGVRQICSPNFNDRPAAVEIDLLVIHNISLPPGQYGTGHIEALFTNCLDITAHPYFQGLAGLEVSSHLLIDRRGEMSQFVSFDKRAWHAGVSHYCFNKNEQRSNCNDYSIGIELEGTDTDPYTEEQYHSLAGVIAELMLEYPRITQERIVGHSDIAPQRKSDPGPAFRWDYLRRLLMDDC